MRAPDPFDAFWAAYPSRRPNPKAAAKAQWQRELRTAIKPEEIVAAAVRYAAECRDKGIDPKFVPYAMRWLQRRQYLDYPAELVDAPAPAPDATPQDRLRAGIGDAAYASWIVPCALTADGDTLTVNAPSQFTAKFVAGKFVAALKSAWGVGTVEIRVAGEPL